MLIITQKCQIKTSMYHCNMCVRIPAVQPYLQRQCQQVRNYSTMHQSDTSWIVQPDWSTISERFRGRQWIISDCMLNDRNI